MIYVFLQSPSIAKERVKARVQRGGHGVPENKIAARYTRSLENLRWFAAKATCYWILDNSDSTPGVLPRMLAYGSCGSNEFLQPDAPEALRQILAM